MPITRELQVKFWLFHSSFCPVGSPRSSVFVLSMFCGAHSTFWSPHFTVYDQRPVSSGVSEHTPRAARANGQTVPIELDSHSDSWIALGQSNSPRNSRIAFFFQIRSTLKYIEAVNRFSNLFYCVCVHALIWINRKSSKPAGFFCSPVTCDVFIQSE